MNDTATLAAVPPVSPVLPHHRSSRMPSLATCCSPCVPVTSEMPNCARRPCARPRARASTSRRGAGRVTRADKARAYAIARAEGVEAAAAVEIAALCGDAPEAAAREVLRLADRLYALLTPLARG